MTAGARDERGEEQNREEEKMKCGSREIYCDPFGSPGTPLKACNQT